MNIYIYTTIYIHGQNKCKPPTRHSTLTQIIRIGTHGDQCHKVLLLTSRGDRSLDDSLLAGLNSAVGSVRRGESHRQQTRLNLVWTYKI